MSRKGMELGHGSHGVVYEVIDFEDMQIYAGKEFFDVTDYKLEKE